MVAARNEEATIERCLRALAALDWLFGLSLIRLLTDCGLPVAAVGNNMLVTRAADASIGGYEALAFSITEDLQLFTHIVA